MQRWRHAFISSLGQRPRTHEAQAPALKSAIHFLHKWTKALERGHLIISHLGLCLRLDVNQRLWRENSQLFKSEKAIDEIGKLTRVLGHERVATTRELGQPRARNGIDELQRIRRRNYDVLAAGGD